MRTQIQASLNAVLFTGQQIRIQEANFNENVNVNAKAEFIRSLDLKFCFCIFFASCLFFPMGLNIRQPLLAWHSVILASAISGNGSFLPFCQCTPYGTLSLLLCWFCLFYCNVQLGNFDKFTCEYCG